MEYECVSKGITIKVSIKKDNESFLKFYGDYIIDWLREEAEKFECVLLPEDDLKKLCFNIMAGVLLEDGIDSEGFEGKFTDTAVRESVIDKISRNFEVFCVEEERSKWETSEMERDTPKKKTKGFADFESFLQQKLKDMKKIDPLLTEKHIRREAAAEWILIQQSKGRIDRESDLDQVATLYDVFLKTRDVFLKTRVAELKKNSPHLENSDISEIALQDWERIRQQLGLKY